MTTDALRHRLLEVAHKLGFDLCRFAAAAAPIHADRFRDWLARGAAGEMEYLRRNADKRCNPQQVLAGAKTVIVLGQNYFQGRKDGVLEGGAKGRLARYAWGDDYHRLIEKRLNILDNFLRENGGDQKCYVDTGPVLERDHAAAAGVG